MDATGSEEHHQREVRGRYHVGDRRLRYGGQGKVPISI